LPKVAYGVSPIGLGHATRTLPVVERLAAAGADVRLFSGGDAMWLLSQSGFQVDDIVSDTAPSVSAGEMKMAALWYVRSWAGLRRTSRRTARLFREMSPDLVVCDEEFSGIGVAARTGLPRVFVSDELELGFARGRVARAIERRVDAWYRRLQDSVDLLVIPEFGADSGNRRRVGPIVRRVTQTRAEARMAHGLPPDGSMVLVSMSGSRVGGFVLDLVMDALSRGAVPDAFVAVSGNRGPKVAAGRVFDLGPVLDNQNLVAAADLVVSTAGKSTQDEAAAAGTPFIGIPIRHHAEQERNAAALGLGWGDAGRLGGLMAERIGRRSAPAEYDGADRAARLILSRL
jgi:UDP-N-acetylglucosamine--N-acetylmuramyl-(pentapeptide) pyrophosphoryl-undecaprenol N-acetylglucosamine transferase